MSLLASIGTWIKSHIVISCVIGTVVIGGAIATPIIVNNLSDSNNEIKENNKKDITDYITPQNEREGLFNLNDNIEYHIHLSYWTHIIDICDSNLLPSEIELHFRPSAAERLADHFKSPDMTKCYSNNIKQEVVDNINTWPGVKIYSGPKEITIQVIDHLTDIGPGKVATKPFNLKVLGIKKIFIIDPIKHNEFIELIENINSSTKNLRARHQLVIYWLDNNFEWNYILEKYGYEEKEIDSFAADGKTPIKETIKSPNKHMLNEQTCKDYNLKCGRW